MMDNTQYIGIDITKSKFDIASVSEGNKTHTVFNNSTAGIKSFVQFLTDKNINKAHHDLCHGYKLLMSIPVWVNRLDRGD